MTDKEYIELLKGEIVETMGCTDPGCISFCVARAASELGARPERISLTLSRNLYKNAASVTLPGAGMSGFYIAAALGAVICRPDDGLAMLRHVSPEVLSKASEYMKNCEITVRCDHSVPTLYVRAEVHAGGSAAHVVICHDYQHIAEVGKDGEVIEKREYTSGGSSAPLLRGVSFESLWDKALSVPTEQLEFLLDCAGTMLRTKEDCLNDPCVTLPRAIPCCSGCGEPGLELALRVQRATAAAGEGRMRGLMVPIFAIAGSGNHGVVNFLGVYEAALGLNATREQTLRALAISSTLVIAIKHSMTRMSAFCGCAVATATALSAAVVYLLGGSFAQAESAMHSLLGTLSGLLCDGAKVSCAYKLSSAAYLAVQFAFAAAGGCAIGSGDGVVGECIEDTVENVSRLNSMGMEQLDSVIVDIIQNRNMKRERRCFE